MILRFNLFIILSLLTISNSRATYYFPIFDKYTNFLLINGIGDLMNQASEDPTYPEFSDKHYKERFMELSGAIQYKLTTQIKTQILYRVNKIRSSTERTMGLTEMYFPVFEEYLSKKGMPRHLKYLPIVESNLNPVAKSHAAAVGLWQFIPGTGKMYGLKITSYVDERSDTHKATDAATTMLSSLYKRYGDWCLALAAYNCGPGRIDKLVKSKGYDYWLIRKYLPKETQMYVPFFMAVVYTYEYHAMHNLKTRSLERDIVLTDTLHLANGYRSLAALATKYGVSKDVLKRLNPVYTKNYVPSGLKNVILVLPARIVAKERGLEEKYNRIVDIKTDNPIKCIRRVNNENELKQYMAAHICNKEDVFFWNRLPDDYKIQPNDLLAFRRYYAPKDTKYKALATRKDIKGIKIHSLKVVGLDDEQEKAVTSSVYINIKKSKKVSNLSVVAPTAAAPQPSYSNVKAGSTSSSSIGVPSAKAKNNQKILERVANDRSRGRRLRSSQTQKVVIPTTTSNTTNSKLAIPATKPATKKITAEPAQRVTKINETALENVKELGKTLQEQEQKILHKNSNQEEKSTLNIIEQQTQKMKLERASKNEVKLPNRTRGRNLR